MTTLKTHMALAATLAGVIAIGATTSSSARDRTWAYAGAGFAAGALLGAAVAGSNRSYYGPNYAYPYNYPYGAGYAPGYTDAPGYAYAPAYRYAEPAPAYVYTPAPAYAYGYPYYREDRRSTTVKSSNEE